MRRGREKQKAVGEERKKERYEERQESRTNRRKRREKQVVAGKGSNLFENEERKGQVGKRKEAYRK